MLTALIFIIVIGVLVLVHEFGHFIFAKKAGMKVEEFGFGFPPRLWGVKKGETTYSINWIPFGGFVKILGEDGDERGPRSFASGSFGQRILVIVAGVLMNILLAAVFLVIVNFFGLRVGISDQEAAGYQDLKIQIVEVSAGSPAAAAGLQPLDEIRGYSDGGTFYAIHTTEELQNLTAQRQDRPITLELTRGATDIEKTLTPRANPPQGQGALGISLAMTGIVHYPWYESLWRGFYDTGIIIINTILGYYYLLKTLIIHGTLIAEVSGPIGIAGLTGQAARIGITYLLQFVALISVNLAVLNIIPFPALDGGRALMLIIEKIKGSPIHRKTEMVINMAGFYVLIALMVYITYKDISKFF
ncbi:MAG TPA: site-2 protease family protein [Candidatus Paceibacterota bacterium]|nr:site-2 protease family protein [Candidatus Paceibacterota bacterium]